MIQKYRAFFIILGLVLTAILLWYFRSIVAYIVVAAVFTLIGSPLVGLITKINIRKFKIPHSLAAALVLVFFWLIIIGFFSFFIPLIASEANKFSSIDVNAILKSFEEPIARIKEFIGGTSIIGEEGQSFEQYLAEKFASILSISYLSNFFGTIAGALGNLFIAMFSISFITFFLLKGEHVLGRAIIDIVPTDVEEKVSHILESITKLIKRYLIGIIVQVSMIMILASIGLSMVGINFSTVLLIALFVGIINVIPYVGPIIGIIFSLVIGVAANLDLPFYTGILPLMSWMLIVLISIQILDNIVFQPLIYGSSVNAQPLEIFLVIMMAGSLAGITGMVLAIPSYTIIRIIAKEFFNKFKIVKKLTENI